MIRALCRELTFRHTLTAGAVTLGSYAARRPIVSGGPPTRALLDIEAIGIAVIVDMAWDNPIRL
jgi:hypothetical protein